MPAQRRRKVKHSPDEELFATAKKRRVPFEFVLAEVEALEPFTRPMFGCTAVYVDDKIVLVLRDRPGAPLDNGVWIATVVAHHGSLRAELPCMRSIGVLGAGTTGWQVLPVDAPDFEEAVVHACALVKQRDARIGKVPAPRRPRGRPSPRSSR
jgi:hypothetical protein